MTKILMTSVRNDEEEAIDAYAKLHHIEIQISRDEFHPETMPDLTDIDGLVIQQTAAIGGDQSFCAMRASNSGVRRSKRKICIRAISATDLGE